MAAKSPKKSTGKAATKSAKKVAAKKSVKAARAGSTKPSSKATKTKKSAPANAAAKTRKVAKPAPAPKTQTKPTKSKARTGTASSAATKPTPIKPSTPKSPVIKKKSLISRPISVSAPSGDSPFKNFIPYEPKRGEPYMTTDQLEHFRMILLRWRQELMEEVDRTVHHMQDEAANFPDPADRATQEEEFSIELRTRDRERKLIKKIDQTVDRIDQEDYGYCDTCGIEIGLRRLEARPTASQCVDCKTLDEIKERQQLGG